MNVNELKEELTNDLEALKKKTEKGNMWPMTWEQRMTQMLMSEFALQQINKLENLEYNRKVKVPKNVARWIEYCKCHGYSLKMALEYPTPDKNYEEAAKEWILLNESIFAQAWLSEDYEVEEEPKYYVELPGIGFLIKRILGEGFFINCHKLDNGRVTSKLTRAEICILNSNYLQFAVRAND